MLKYCFYVRGIYTGVLFPFLHVKPLLKKGQLQREQIHFFQIRPLSEESGSRGGGRGGGEREVSD